ncbi:MAG: hypothetical protein K6D59_06805, partial [Bacteroidales bacterium]|nr:hypothetical protein [Bacteroidales bacterium]
MRCNRYIRTTSARSRSGELSRSIDCPARHKPPVSSTAAMSSKAMGTSGALRMIKDKVVEAHLWHIVHTVATIIGSRSVCIGRHQLYT